MALYYRNHYATANDAWVGQWHLVDDNAHLEAAAKMPLLDDGIKSVEFTRR